MSLFSRFLFTTACLAAVTNTPALAQEISVFGPPLVAYEGHRTIVTSEANIAQTVHSKPGKNRSEMHMDGQSVIQIWRDDLKTLWSISPDQGIAMEFPYGSEQTQSPLDSFDEQTTVLEKRYIGKETVNGVITDHHYMRSTMSGGGTTSGDVWTTPENVTVRMRMTQISPGEAAQQISYDLTGLRVTHQPDELFEIPAGYQVMSMGAGGLPSVVGGVGGYAGDVANDAAQEARHEADRQVRYKVRNETAKAVRKILPW
tara:strand:- start:34527 stop:35300 length:774 start_codon:yes stop_codon:yes gene_type:complete